MHEPKDKKALEGAYTRIGYLIPADRSPLEVLRNYQDEIKSRGGKILYECKAEECGGNPASSSAGGGGDMSLAMYQYDSCRAFNGRTVAIVDILEAKDREKNMVTVDAGAMAKALESTGHVALYGIYFDFNKADVKPESDATLQEMAKLLKETPGQKLLVVGHTDNVGSFSFNMDLSQRRAAAVVAALATRFGIAKDRLTPVGVSFASPVAPNADENGRAKNRRVELVDNTVVAK